VSPSEILSAAREMLVMTLFLVSPVLAVAILASLVVGLIQASTLMNDLTLSFVPRFFAVLAVVALGATWAAGHMAAYLAREAAVMRGLVP
jgi:flagellar biosynthetic protein FliQ